MFFDLFPQLEGHVHFPQSDGHGLLEPWNEYPMFAIVYNSILQLAMAPTWFVILTNRPPGGLSGAYFCLGEHQPRRCVAEEVAHPLDGELFPFYIPNTQQLVYLDTATFAFLRLAYIDPYTLQVGFSTVDGVPSAPSTFENVNTDGYYIRPCMATDTSNARYVFAVSSTTDNFRVYYKPSTWQLFTTISCMRTRTFSHYRNVNDFYLLYYTPGDLLTLVWLEQNTSNFSGFGYNTSGGPGVSLPVDVQIIVRKVDGIRRVIACYRDTTFGRVAIAVCMDFLGEAVWTVYLGPTTAVTPRMVMDGNDVIAFYVANGTLGAQRAGDYRYLGNNVDDKGVALGTGFSGPLDAHLGNGWVTIVATKGSQIYSIHRELLGAFISRRQ